MWWRFQRWLEASSMTLLKSNYGMQTLLNLICVSTFDALKCDIGILYIYEIKIHEHKSVDKIYETNSTQSKHSIWIWCFLFIVTPLYAHRFFYSCFPVRIHPFNYTCTPIRHIFACVLRYRNSLSHCNELHIKPTAKLHPLSAAEFDMHLHFTQRTRSFECLRKVKHKVRYSIQAMRWGTYM